MLLSDGKTNKLFLCWTTHSQKICGATLNAGPVAGAWATQLQILINVLRRNAGKIIYLSSKKFLELSTI